MLRFRMFYSPIPRWLTSDNLTFQLKFWKISFREISIIDQGHRKLTCSKYIAIYGGKSFPTLLRLPPICASNVKRI